MILQEHMEAKRDGWLKRDNRPVWQVADNFYGCDRTRPPSEKWQLTRTPWARQILDDSINDKVRELVSMAPSQAAKTAPMLIRLAWGMARRPVPRLWITGDAGLAGDAFSERIDPTLRRCPDLRGVLILDRFHMAQSKISTRFSTLDIAGAKESGALHQNPYGEVYADECGNEQLWPEGQIQRIGKRMRSYVNEGAKAFLFSAPGRKGAEFHQRYLAGTQNEWFYPCMKCGAINQLTWKGLKYGEVHDGKTESGHNGSNEEVEEIAFACASCSFRHEDNSAVRRHIVEAGHWQAQNPTPEEGVVSYHWNALLPPWIRWADLVKEWIQANRLLKVGNVEALKIFVCETLGEPWEEGQQHERKEVTAASYQMDELQGVLSAWNAVYMTVDVGAREFHYIVRGWRHELSRALAIGVASTWDELREVAAKFGLDGFITVGKERVPLSRRVFVDSRFSVTRTQNECHLHCAKYGWTAFMGEDRDYYQETVKGRAVRRLYSEHRMVDVHIGTAHANKNFCVQFMFADGKAQDLLQQIMDGKLLKWETPSDAPTEYKKHLVNEVKGWHRKGKGGKQVFGWHRIGDQHFRDCEKMSCVAASMGKLIYELPEPEKEEK